VRDASEARGVERPRVVAVHRVPGAQHPAVGVLHGAAHTPITARSDPPKHDRIKALFQRGFTPKRIAEHEEAIRAITVEVLDRLEGRETCDLVDDVAQPVVARVIATFMGLPPEDDQAWANLMNTILGAGDPDTTPEGA
jgi:cytochrome P450